MERLVFSKQVNKKAWDKISHLFDEKGRVCSKEEFESLNHDEASPNGNIVIISDDDFPLMLNNRSEARLASLFASSGVIRSIRGQNFILPYKKPWAKNSSPYYPDFILHLHDGRIAFIELKSALGMAQDETICKYAYLQSFCHQKGYLCAMVDVDLLTFEEYLWPINEDEVTRAFHLALDSLGGFNNLQLEGILQGYSKNKHQEIRRKIACCILLDPYVSNRYCHDDPRLINAVKESKILPYKIFH